ncbi:MAG: type VI secretion system contractile sheath domain-containing protein [Planctomycetota bacterium]|jgi:type VI secretion system protein ImpC
MAEHPEPPDLEVNIPSPDGLRVTGEEPYHILVVSDFAGSDRGSLTGTLEKGVVAVTADTFDEVMAQADPCVSYTTADPLASGSVMVELGLRFESLRSFGPEALAQQIPVTRSLTEIRERIATRMRGELSADALSQAVSQAVTKDASLEWLVEAIKPSTADAPAAPEAVDSLLDQLDLGGEEAEQKQRPAAKSPIGSLVSAAAAQGAPVPPGEASSLRRALAEIDRRITVWLTAVLHSPEVRQLESAWRSLAFLVSKTDFRKGLRLSILHAPRDKMIERFVSFVIDPVFDEGAPAPDLIAVDAQFGNSASDLETLDELAQHAASLPAVALAGLSPAFLGVKHAWQVPTLPPIVNMLDQWQFAKWKSLRNEPYARNLGVLFGRCLLRAPYERKEGTDLDFRFQEKCISDKDFVWASGAIAGACTVARSVADTGWPAAMAGHVHGRIEGLHIVQAGKKGDKQFGPSDAQIPQPKIEEMGMAGINVVAGLREGHDALLWNGLTAGKPPSMDPNGLLEVSLPYHLFAGRLSALLFALKPHLEGMAAEKLCASVIGHVRTWLKLEGDADAQQVSAQVREAQDDPTSFELAVTVTPPQSLVPGGIPLVLGYKIARG